MSDFHEHHNYHYDCYQYTALGNSIAFGVGASFTINDTKKHRYGYVYYFRDFLKTIFPCVNLINFADPGFTSSDLLHQLQTNAETREAVKKADLITISIGGADLLNCFFPSPSTDPACLQKAVAAFAQNWPIIMREIRKSIRSYAEIFVMTVYNPFRGDDPFFSRAKPLIQRINDVIKANRFIFNYDVVDVHADFLGRFMNTIQWKVCTWTHFCAVLDPHPTDSGHLEIARLHELKFLKNNQDRLLFDGESSDESSD